MKAVASTGCAALVILLSCSCSRRAQVSSPLSFATLTFPEMRTADMDSPTLSVTIPEINLGMLDLDEFLPPGSVLIQPRPAVPVVTSAVPKVRYPSTAETPAPNGDATVGTSSYGPARLLHHSLLLFRRGDDAASPIFTTTKSFDLMWAPNSRVFAISHSTGNNGSQVLIGNVRDRASPAVVATEEAVERYFPSGYLNLPHAQKAYKWSRDSLLIVRTVGRITTPPFGYFGYEVLIDPEYPKDTQRMKFLRGFIPKQ
ncbi:MAG: hypothetical protein H7343_17385 [Undibacterium sp.]|nr:hypothetical protein [Opitutaceae bacterium]